MSEIETIKEAVFQVIKAHNGQYDLVDIACKFPGYTCDIPSMAVTVLVKEGRVERREVYGTRRAYFVKEE